MSNLKHIFSNTDIWLKEFLQHKITSASVFSLSVSTSPKGKQLLTASTHSHICLISRPILSHSYKSNIVLLWDSTISTLQSHKKIIKYKNVEIIKKTWINFHSFCKIPFSVFNILKREIGSVADFFLTPSKTIKCVYNYSNVGISIVWISANIR